MNLSEHSIIDGLKHGDNWAYKHIYDYHYVLLCKIAYSFLKDDFLAKALVSDLIIDIYEKRETLVITFSLRSYLVRAVINDCRDYFKSEQFKQKTQTSTLDMSDNLLTSIENQNDYPLGTLLEKELEQEIRLAVERLPVECRTVFEKSRFEGKTYEAIATELNISVNTVKYHIKNALSQLRKDLDKFLVLIIIYLYLNFYF